MFQFEILVIDTVDTNVILQLLWYAVPRKLSILLLLFFIIHMLVK